MTHQHFVYLYLTVGYLYTLYYRRDLLKDYENKFKIWYMIPWLIYCVIGAPFMPFFLIDTLFKGKLSKALAERETYNDLLNISDKRLIKELDSRGYNTTKKEIL